MQKQSTISNNIYSYLEQAVQHDHSGVAKSLWNWAKSIKPDWDIEEIKMYNTNSMICNFWMV